MDIKNTVFISDMDGTLLNSSVKISEYTRSSLNSLIAKGLNFTVATARTAATVVKMLEGVNINLPVILMNGVCVYDMKSKRYIKKEVINSESKIFLLNTLKAHKITGFLYTITDDKLSTYYENIDSKPAQDFVNERTTQYGKIFTKVESLHECIDKDIVYFSTSNSKDNLDVIYKDLKVCESLHIEYYNDIYNKDMWYLEVCSCTASKYNATVFLKSHLGINYMVGFGDNLNDLPLFSACNENYAVENAKDEVKRCANEIIESNEDDGVAKFLNRLMG